MGGIYWNIQKKKCDKVPGLDVCNSWSIDGSQDRVLSRHWPVDTRQQPLVTSGHW